MAIAGASKYAAAVASGDVADEEAKALRIGRCRTCPSLTLHTVPVLGVVSGFCGQPFHDGADETPRTCGCLTAVATAPQRADGEEPDDVYRERVRAVLTVAGKACVGSAQCSQGRW